MTQPQPKKSDLPTRAASAVVMVAVAGTALWLGGWWWTALVAAVALGVLWEWQALASAMTTPGLARFGWLIGGFVYIATAAATLVVLRWGADGAALVVTIVGAVIAVDVGAYFAGRAIGGPKIAPRISPNKTWAGLGGGIVAAALALIAISGLHALTLERWVSSQDPVIALAAAVPLAIVAQAGDFFESWMKRRAGVKDSGSLLPGHGGLFDRLDGLLAVLFALGVTATVFSR